MSLSVLGAPPSISQATELSKPSTPAPAQAPAASASQDTVTISPAALHHPPYNV